MCRKSAQKQVETSTLETRGLQYPSPLHLRFNIHKSTLKKSLKFKLWQRSSFTVCKHSIQIKTFIPTLSQNQKCPNCLFMCMQPPIKQWATGVDQALERMTKEISDSLPWEGSKNKQKDVMTSSQIKEKYQQHWQFMCWCRWSKHGGRDAQQPT